MNKALFILLMGVSSLSVANTTTITAIQACYLGGYYVEKGNLDLADFWRLRIKEGPHWDGSNLSRECIDVFNEGVNDAYQEENR